MIDASSAEFAAGDRFREEAARRWQQREAVDQEARAMEAAEADAEAAQPLVTVEAEAARPTASAAPEGMEMEH